MSKKSYFVLSSIFLLLMMTLIIGYTFQKSPKEPPNLSITVGDKELKYITAKNTWNGSKYDREDTFKTILKKGSPADIPYIEIGKTVVIRFKNHPPAKFTIYDNLIDEKGNRLYSNKEINKIPVTLKDGQCSFEIQKHLASALSSTYIENKTDIRGFRMIASWGENECEYAFVVRTKGF